MGLGLGIGRGKNMRGRIRARKHVPAHLFFAALMVNPGLHSLHMAAPFLVQAAPLIATPLSHVHMLADTHTHTHIHTYTCTHIHAHTHANKYRQSCDGVKCSFRAKLTFRLVTRVTCSATCGVWFGMGFGVKI